ncbi:NYN domain-containing protein [Comamonas serinivorans]|uniref:NYN domain-containing protein n=1 Tax=Comamonas serinivorans TaxID=1082851 RepID=A0A1Y0EJS2_9BURK|nr:NYN domain-containing protein [Comamonas serinivorans]ARU03678.1 NYN domain-containing protein [Comamonas serinivorans]
MRTVWIIDAAYLFNHGKSRPFDYLKLKNHLETLNGEPLYESYFLNSAQDTSSDDLQGFYNWLKSAPPKGPKFRVQLYKLKSMHLRCPDCGKTFDRQVQKGVDVGIATLIIKLAAQGAYDRLILCAGDGDFEDAISYVKSELRKEIWLCGSMTNLSPDLQSYADKVLWLEDMSPMIDR